MAVSELYYVKLLLAYLERCFERMASDVRESNAAPEPPYTSCSLSHKFADAVWAGNTDGPLMICTPLAPTVQYALCTCYDVECNFVNEIQSDSTYLVTLLVVFAQENLPWYVIASRIDRNVAYAMIVIKIIVPNFCLIYTQARSEGGS